MVCDRHGQPDDLPVRLAVYRAEALGRLAAAFARDGRRCSEPHPGRTLAAAGSSRPEIKLDHSGGGVGGAHDDAHHRHA